MASDWSRYWRSGDQPLEAMHAHFQRHAYHRHSHETYSFGLTSSPPGQAHIDTHLVPIGGQWRGCTFYDERGVVPAVGFTDHRDRRWRAEQRPGPADLDLAHLRHIQPPPAEREPVAGQADRLAAALAAEHWVPDPAPLTVAGQGVEPVPVDAGASLHACTSATDDTCASHARSGVSLARVTTRRCTLGIADPLTSCVAFLAQPQAVVVDDAGAAEHPGQRLPLSWGRAHAVAVTDQHKPQNTPGL